MEKKMERKIKILTRVDVVGTLRQLDPGDEVEFKAKEFAPYTSVASAVSRINSSGDPYTFELKSMENGTIFRIRRI